ncbi:MAG: ABC transporter permease subunit [Actinomycetota bacterium]|nr:ABC transporter permease subunit [Actinomycetota bacterium]
MINRSLLRYQLKTKKRSMFFFSIALLLWGFMITALYPTVSDLQGFSDYWTDFPDTFKNLFGGHEVNILKPEGYITLEYYQLFLPIILAAFALGFAAFCVVKARENGTMEILFTHPIERWRYALTSFLSMSAGLAVLSVVGVGSVMLTARIFGIDLDYLGQLKFIVLIYFFVLALGSIGLLASCGLNKAGQVYAVGITLLAASYLVNFLSNNWSFFGVIDHAFLYYYYDPYGLMTQAGFQWFSIIYYGVIIAFSAFLSTYTLQRRDIAI